MIRTKNVKDNYFDSKSFLKILKAVNMGGVIDEFAITIKNNIGTIVSVDKNACLFVFSSGDVGKIKDASFGIKDGGFLIKAIEANALDQISCIIEEDRWFKINIPNVGDIKLLLVDVDMIPTSIKDYQEPIKKIKESVILNFDLCKDGCAQFVLMQNLVKNEITRIFIEENKIYVGSGKNETRTFCVKIGEIKAEDKGSLSGFSTVVKGSDLVGVFSFVSWDNNDVIMGLGEGPVLIHNGDNFLWGLSQAIDS